MTRTKLKSAIAEAERFITKARIALENNPDGRYDSMEPSKHNATATRASLDLSRALSEMRKPR
jgi:hypothetical protein